MRIVGDLCVTCDFHLIKLFEIAMHSLYNKEQCRCFLNAVVSVSKKSCVQNTVYPRAFQAL